MNIGGFLGGIGRKIGSGVKQGINKLGELQADGLDDGAPMPQPMPRRPITGGFAGNEGVPKFDLGRIGRTRSDTGGTVEAQPMPQRLPVPAVNVAPPVEMRPNYPPLTGFDQGTGRMMDQEVAPIRDSVTIRPDAEPRPAPMRGGMPSAIPMPNLPSAPDPNDDRQNVPIPGLPNRGGPIPYSPYEAARYDSVMEGAKRDTDGNLLTKEQGGGFKRTWGNSLKNALLGAANAYAANPQGGLGALAGGALGGGIGATFNPQAGLEQVFDAGPGRQMLEDQARRDTEIERQRKARMGGLGERAVTADVGLKELQLKRAQGRRVGEATWGTYDQETGQPIWQRPPGQSSTAAPRRYNVNGTLVDETGKVIFQGQPKPPTMQDALGEEEAAEGSVEQITQDTYAGRGGRDYVISKMPPQLQQAIKNPTQPDYSALPSAYQQILANPPAAGDAQGIELLTKAEQAKAQIDQRHQALVMQAQNELQQMEARELADIRRQAEATRRSNASKRRVGGASRPSGGGQRSQPAPTTVSRAAVEGYAKEKGVSFEEAAARFAQKGIQVR